MEARKWPVLAAILYPFATATMAAGLLAFVMILLKLDLLLIATVVLWFYFTSATAIYIISKKILRSLGLHKFFLSFTITIGALAILSAVLLGLRLLGRV
jgi:hypothetical protein